MPESSPAQCEPAAGGELHLQNKATTEEASLPKRVRSASPGSQPAAQPHPEAQPLQLLMAFDPWGTERGPAHRCTPGLATATAPGQLPPNLESPNRGLLFLGWSLPVLSWLVCV